MDDKLTQHSCTHQITEKGNKNFRSHASFPSRALRMCNVEEGKENRLARPGIYEEGHTRRRSVCSQIPDTIKRKRAIKKEVGTGHTVRFLLPHSTAIPVPTVLQHQEPAAKGSIRLTGGKMRNGEREERLHKPRPFPWESHSIYDSAHKTAL